jgi:hypothetical protein
MTTWQEFPLRPAGRPWPGLNTRGGALDNGTGQLEDGSFGQIINEADILEKRKGMVRGLNENFDGVVCGLFKYTDDCGREWLLVADEEQISIRMPFVIPVFTDSDAYPFDSFTTTLATPILPIDTLNWRSTGDYQSENDSMVQVIGVPAFTGLQVPDADIMRWFKEATNKSYQVRVQYAFVDTPIEQHVSIVIKGNGDLTSGAFLQADLQFQQGGTHQVRLLRRDSTGAIIQLLVEPVTGQPSGFLTLQYQRDTSSSSFLPGIQLFPTGGVPIIKNAPSLNAIQDANLGQISGIGMGYKGSQAQMEILVVDGGPI